MLAGLCRKYQKTLLKLCRKGLTQCNLRAGSTDATCVKSVVQQLDGGQRTCLCNVECEEQDYDLSISQAMWPSWQYQVLAQKIMLIRHHFKTFHVPHLEMGNGSIWFYL